MIINFVLFMSSFVVKIFLPNHVWNNYSQPLLEKTLRSTAS